MHPNWTAVALGLCVVLSSCELLQSDPTESAEPTGSTARAEASDGLGPGVLEGVPAILIQRAGRCTGEYVPVDGVCINRRFRARESPEALARHIDLFKRGAVPPVIAAARSPQPLPEDLDPAALMARVEQLAREAKAHAEQVIREQKAERARREREQERQTAAPTTGDDGAATAKAEDSLNEHVEMLRRLHDAKSPEDLTQDDLDRMLGYMKRHGKRLPEDPDPDSN